ncbi:MULTISPECIES: amidohydrolase family protein [Acinetobacter]|uniref:amidohydrolase family protein n=1 Tax=Acinetobacter TaxID=469 RepID=UPI000EA053BC|nr:MULTISPECIES: amidohydrolase family protein [Acinetobacter]RKG46799.1 amidohydrolase [Acinetobacter cumulans]RZG62192.1 amidohydrolase [Acinetobacter sp. WCHAc060006]
MSQINFAIVDPHIHQWDPYTTPHTAGRLVKLLGKHPKLMYALIHAVKPKPLLETVGHPEHILKPYLPHDYKKDCGNYMVEAVAHIEASWHHHKGFGVVEETQWIKQLPFHTQQLKLGAIVATADPRDRKFKKILEAHQQASPLFRGIRKMASWHPDAGIHRWCDQSNLYTQKSFLKGFEHLTDMQLSFDAWGYANQINDIKSLAQNFQNTPIMLDHLATPVGLFGKVGKSTGYKPSQRKAIFQQWKDDISHLAEQKNVHAKISGLMMPVLGHGYFRTKRTATVNEMVELLSPMIEHAVAVFGTDRIVYASNYPMDKPNAKLTDLIEAYIHMLSPYGAENLQKMMRDNAIAFYKMDLKKT